MPRHIQPSPKEIAAVQKWERETLSGYITSMASVGPDTGLTAFWHAVEALILAQSPNEVIEVIEANPALLTERCDPVFMMTEMFVRMTGMPFATAIMKDRRDWLNRMRELGGGTAIGGPPDV